jgi:hypothetical protein
MYREMEKNKERIMSATVKDRIEIPTISGEHQFQLIC